MIPVSRFTTLTGNIHIPRGAKTLVIFSHGSGSSRFSPRNNFVADILNREKIATLLTDLLTKEEDSIYENRFDIELLTERLISVTAHALGLPELRNFSTGYFGASTGAASALNAASVLKEKISAVVSRGGRPDMAVNTLHLVKAPTLLLVGSLDNQVIELNRFAFEKLTCVKRLEIVKGATHLFEEAGKLEEVARSAGDWFKKYLKTGTTVLMN